MNLNRFVRFGLVGSVSLASIVAASGPATIGLATALGTFKVNSADVEGNANLFEGSQLSTGKAASQIFLKGGAVMTLASNSVATLYGDHFVLRDGTSRISKMGSYSAEAGSYVIKPDVPSTESVVRVTTEDVQVAAVSGSLSVLNKEGALLTHVGAGTASAFNRDAGQGQSPPPNYRNRTRPVVLYTALVGVSAGLGLATDAILQKGETSRNAISP